MYKYTRIIDIISSEIVDSISNRGGRALPQKDRESVRSSVADIFMKVESGLHSGWFDSGKDVSWIRLAEDALPPNAVGSKGVNLADLRKAVDSWWPGASPEDRTQVYNKLHPPESVPDSLFSMLSNKTQDEIAKEFPAIDMAMKIEPSAIPAPVIPEALETPETPEASEKKESAPGKDKHSEHGESEEAVRRPSSPTKPPEDEFTENIENAVPGSLPGDRR